MKTRVLLAGEGHGAQAAFRGLCNGQVSFEVLTEDPILKEEARKNNIALAANLEGWIQSEKDIVFSSAYRPIVPNHVLQKCRFLNVHYALFPKYRGMHSIVWAMLNGEKNIGITFHRMNELADAGPIIFQRPVAVGDKTSHELMVECNGLCEQLSAEVILKYIDGLLPEVPQDETTATYVAKRRREDCLINWKEWNAVYLSRILKAIVEPYPLPYFIYKNNEYEILEAEVVFKNYHEIPGHVVYRHREGVFIKLIDGLLLLKSVRDSNKNKLAALDLFKMPGARL